MHIISLNIGLPGKAIFQGKEIYTGMCKRPVSGPVYLAKSGFIGDGVGDTRHHGGADKAVCIYSGDHYAYWERVFGIKLPSSAFGENLTVSGLDEKSVCIGDIYTAGTAVVQISQPRQPCGTLAARFGRTDMTKLVINSGRTGFYCRVLEEGQIEPGTSLILKEQDPGEITIAFANRIYHHDRNNCKGIERVLAVSALSDTWRQSFMKLRDACGK